LGSIRQTLFSWWCVTAAPLILGTDLTTNIDSYDYSLLHNSEVIAVNQAGIQAAPVVDYLTSDPGGSQPETWRAKEADSSFTILVSNPSGNTQTGTTAWSLFGIPGPVLVRDLLNGVNLIGTPNQDGGYQVPGPLPYNLTAYQSAARISLSSHRLRALTEKSWRLAREAITRLRLTCLL
jgi:hypothetical protein